VSFHTSEDAIALEGVSVMLVPPAASTHGDVAGQDAAFCSSKLVSWEVGTRAHTMTRLSPAATTTVTRGGGPVALMGGVMGTLLVVRGSVNW
jgi:hypothetical protein